jgi:predicted permease
MAPKRPNDRDLDTEVEHHLDQLTAEHERRGLTPKAAREAARKDFGRVAQMKDVYRDQRGLPWVMDLRHDLRYAVRTLLRNRAFTSVAVLTLGLGIGATSAIFSVMNAVLLRPLPYPDADRLVRVIMTLPASMAGSGVPERFQVGLSAAEVTALRAQSRTLSDIGIAHPQLMALSGYENAARLQGARMSASALRVLGARPSLGRLFDESDETAAAEPVILVSYSAWQRFFGGDRTILGRSLTFDSILGPPRQTRYTVVGILPDSFRLPRPHTQFWTSFQVPATGATGVTRGAVIGRLKDGVSLEAASSDVLPFVREARRGQRGNDETRYELVREQDELVAPIRLALRVLMAAAAVLLLIACINVANLTLARASVRLRETAIRAALGAGRGRVIRLLLTESVTLSLLGGLLGVGVAFGGVALLRMLASTVPRFDLAAGAASLEFPRVDEIAIDGTVLAFSSATALVTGVLFGLVVAVRQSRIATIDSLRGGTAFATSGFAGMSVRSFLVVGQVAAAMVLLVGGGLLIRSFTGLIAVDAGYDPSNVLSFQVSLPVTRYSDDRLRAFAEDLVARAHLIPGVEAAGYARQLPLVQLVDTLQLRTSPAGPAPSEAAMAGDIRLISRDYLRVMGIDVIAGRNFEDLDGPGSPRVLLVNEALASRDFPSGTAIGRVVYVGRDSVPWQIVGVVRNVRQFGLEREPAPQFFVDVRQWPGGGLPLFPVGPYYALRATEDPMRIVAQVRAILRDADAEAALFNVAPMEQLVATSTSRPRMYAVLMGAFAALGAVLAVIGIYGLMAYSVAQRTSEIGIRMALGARRAAVMGLVLRHSMLITGVGIAGGLAGAAALMRYLQGMLFGITPADWPTFASVAALFSAVALAAAIVPARRAMKIDPLTALRYE